MKRWPQSSWHVAFGAIAMGLVSAPSLLGHSLFGQEDDGRDFKPRTVIDKAFPAITDVDHVSLEKADATLEDDELVIGVEHKGKFVAYPINMLTGPRREIINDKIAGDAITATW